jgi:hypothetical protein
VIPSAAFTPAYVIPGLIVLGVGQGLFMTPVVNAVLSEIPEAHTGAASGVLNTMQRVGNALGVAILEIPFFSALENGPAQRGFARRGLYRRIRVRRRMADRCLGRGGAASSPPSIAVVHLSSSIQKPNFS